MATVVKQKKENYHNLNSGKSKSSSNPFGKRKVREGKEIAPKSLRRKGKKFISDCSEEDLKKAQVI